MLLIFCLSGHNAFTDTRFNILFLQVQELGCVPEPEDTLAELIQSEMCDISTGKLKTECSA